MSNFVDVKFGVGFLEIKKTEREKCTYYRESTKKRVIELKSKAYVYFKMSVQFSKNYVNFPSHVPDINCRRNESSILHKSCDLSPPVVDCINEGSLNLYMFSQIKNKMFSLSFCLQSNQEFAEGETIVFLSFH